MNLYASTPDQRVKLLIKNIPDEIRNEADAISGMLSEAYWRWGALTNKIYAWARQVDAYTMEDCAQASIIMIGEKYTVQRVLEFANVQSFYQPFIMDGKFEDVFYSLPFVIVEYAKTHGKNWKKVLLWVLKQKVDKKPSSLQATKNHFEPDEPYSKQQPQTKTEFPQPIPDDKDVAENIKSFFTPSYFATTIRNQIRFVEKLSPNKAGFLSIIADLLEYLGNTPDDGISTEGILQILQNRIINKA